MQICAEDTHRLSGNAVMRLTGGQCVRPSADGDGRDRLHACELDAVEESVFVRDLWERRLRAPNDRKAHVREAMAREGLREMPFDFDLEGAKVLVNF